MRLYQSVLLYDLLFIAYVVLLHPNPFDQYLLPNQLRTPIFFANMRQV